MGRSHGLLLAAAIPVIVMASCAATREAPRDWEPRFPLISVAELEPVWMREEDVPRIEYDPRYTEHTPENLAAVLTARRGEIEGLIEVSRDLPEVIPPFGFAEVGDVSSNEHLALPRGRVRNGLRVLRADGVRLHEAGDDVEAFRRFGAAARIALAFATQADELHAYLGTGSGATVLFDVAAVVRDGLHGWPNRDDVEVILALCEHLRRNVPVESPKLDGAIADIEGTLAIGS